MITHQKFEDHTEDGSELTISVHPNGTTFVYGYSGRDHYKGPSSTLVVLDNDQRIALANALTDMDIPNMAEPAYVQDAPAITDEDDLSDVIVHDYIEEPDPFDELITFDPAVSHAFIQGTAEGDTAGFERGYTAGYGDRVMEEQGITPDGYNDPEEMPTVRRIALEFDLSKRGVISGTTF